MASASAIKRTSLGKLGFFFFSFIVFSVRKRTEGEGEGQGGREGEERRDCGLCVYVQEAYDYLCISLKYEMLLLLTL